MASIPRHRRAPRRLPRRLALLVALATAPLVVLLGPSLSSATFTSVTTPALATVQAASDWTPPTVALNAPATAVRGTVTLTATASDADSGIADVRIQARAAGASSWTTVCTVTTSPYSCAWATGTANGTHELRAVATDRAGNTATSAVRTTLVDNQAPSVTMNDPGTPLSGTRTFSATATDAGSGVAQVVIEASNGGAWTTICTRTASPWSCAYDTTALANGTWSFRAVATDAVGNTATSPVVSGRVVDNTPRAISLANPGSPLSGTVTVEATASAPGGVTSVAIQRSPVGANQWTTICTTSSAPYRCSWNTTGVPDGLYDLRAVLTDGQGTLTSNVVTLRRVLNTPFGGADIQAINAGTGQVGRPDAGDIITYTFNREVDTTSIISGWTSGSRTVTPRMGVPAFQVNSVMTIDSVPAMGQIALGTRYNGPLTGNLLDITFPGSTMTAKTEVAEDGFRHTVITIVLGSPSRPTWQGEEATMTWTPSAAVRSAVGGASSTTPVTESGPADRDF